MSGKEQFDLFDSNADGFVTRKELSLALYALGCNPTVKESEALAAQANPAEPDQISWQQFQAILLKAPRPDRTAEQFLTEAFKVFDKNEDGLIPENDIRVIFTTLGEAVEATEINQLLAQVKVDANGKVKYSDFIKTILQ